MKKIIFFFALSVWVFLGCNTEGGVKLTPDDRYRIDTLTSRKTSELSASLEAWCKDSTPIFRQHFIDSLVIVREQEILKQTSTMGQ
jgi:hypothetical protein